MKTEKIREYLKLILHNYSQEKYPGMAYKQNGEYVLRGDVPRRWVQRKGMPTIQETELEEMESMGLISLLSHGRVWYKIEIKSKGREFLKNKK